MKNGSVTLRYIQESDIDNYTRWSTVETEWCDWDAPWETWEDGELVTWQRSLLGKTPDVYYKLEIETLDGWHIGWVSSYNMDGDITGRAVGLDIPPVEARGHGYGADALGLFMAYLFMHDCVNVLYTQTWSGNTAMLRLAEKIGFTEVRRIRNHREVRGTSYDALTFSMGKDEFFTKHPALRMMETKMNQ